MKTNIHTALLFFVLVQFSTILPAFSEDRLNGAIAAAEKEWYEKFETRKLSLSDSLQASVTSDRESGQPYEIEVFPKSDRTAVWFLSGTSFHLYDYNRDGRLDAISILQFGKLEDSSFQAIGKVNLYFGDAFLHEKYEDPFYKNGAYPRPVNLTELRNTEHVDDDDTGVFQEIDATSWEGARLTYRSYASHSLSALQAHGQQILRQTFESPIAIS
jgi:hypothetical protein